VKTSNVFVLAAFPIGLKKNQQLSRFYSS